MSELSKKRVAIIGLGKLGTILFTALSRSGLVDPEQTRATVQHASRAERLSEELGLSVGTDNTEAVADADLVLLCVKPGTAGEVALEGAPHLLPSSVLISVVASVPTAYLEERLQGDVAVVRAMPNTPCEIGVGMTGICRGRHATQKHLDWAEQLFSAIGKTVVVDEKHMDAITGLSASGPAFLYIVLESLAEAGVKVGLPRDTATLLAAQTMQGAAGMVLEKGQHPAQLKDAVTTPAGCTIDGILELEEGKVRVTLIKAVVKATERARDLLLTS